jgi:hypothetical protein
MSAASPAVIASPAVKATNRSLPVGANDATVAADSAAVAAIGPTTSWRELPSAAYKISAPGAAYRPTTGETPAIDAYANASGTSTAHTVTPAIRSPRTHAR